jgi:hypothetical protein
MPPIPQSKRFNLPVAESSLNQKEQERYAEQIGEAAISSGASYLPPASEIPDAVSRDVLTSVQPKEPSQVGISLNATLALQSALDSGVLPADVAGPLAAQIAEAQRQGNGAPIETADARGVRNGRKFSIPASVRDVPNHLTVNKPQRAKELFWSLTDRLTTEQSDELAESASRAGIGHKPLMWLSQILWEHLVLERYLPPKGTSAEGWNMKDGSPDSPAYKAVVEAFGPDCGDQLIVAAERSDNCIEGIIKAVVLRQFAIQEQKVKLIASTQTVSEWKRPR